MYSKIITQVNVIIGGFLIPVWKYWYYFTDMEPNSMLGCIHLYANEVGRVLLSYRLTTIFIIVPHKMYIYGRMYEVYVTLGKAHL